MQWVDEDDEPDEKEDFDMSNLQNMQNVRPLPATDSTTLSYPMPHYQSKPACSENIDNSICGKQYWLMPT